MGKGSTKVRSCILLITSSQEWCQSLLSYVVGYRDEPRYAEREYNTRVWISAGGPHWCPPHWQSTPVPDLAVVVSWDHDLQMASESGLCLMKAREKDGIGLGKYEHFQLPFGLIIYPMSPLCTFFSEMFLDNCRIISGESTYLGVRYHLSLSVVWLLNIWRYKDILLNEYRLWSLISFTQSQASALTGYVTFGKPYASLGRLSFLW